MEVFEQWVLVEADFHHEFHADLSKLLHTESWRWFATRVTWLLANRDTLLGRFFAPPPEPEPEKGWLDGS